MTDAFDTITGNWDYARLPDNVHIGQNCWIERKESFGRFRSKKNPGITLGNGVRVYTWTTFNVEPTGQIEVGNHTTLVGAVFMCANRICIGNRVVISYNVTLADSDFHPQNPQARIQDAVANAPFGDRSQRPQIQSKPITVEDDVHIGIGAILLKGVHIGQGAQIGAGAVITSSIPAYAHVAGNPAQVITPCPV